MLEGGFDLLVVGDCGVFYWDMKDKIIWLKVLDDGCCKGVLIVVGMEV